MPTPDEARVVPKFFNHIIENKAASKEAGRPIFDDMEAVEVRFAGNRQTVSVFPAPILTTDCPAAFDEAVINGPTV